MRLPRTAASAYENVEWINKLTAYVADIAKTKPHIKIFGPFSSITYLLMAS